MSKRRHPKQKSDRPHRSVGPPASDDLPDLRRARHLWQFNHFDAALELFDKAAHEHPRNVTALLDAARGFGARHEIRRAEEWLDRVVELARGDPVTLHLVAQTYRMIFRPDRAMALFESVVAATSDIPDAFLELALLYERRHRLDEAMALIRKCEHAAPDYPEPRLIEARLHRRLGDDARAESLLQALAESSAANPFLRAQAWADLAEIHDRSGEYDRAMETIGRCKAIQLQHESTLKPLSDRLIDNFSSLADEVTTAEFARWRDSVDETTRRPTALLCGFPRTGTTLLEQVLDAHPGVVSVEELDIFARDTFSSLWDPGPNGSVRPTIAAMDALPAPRRLALRDRYRRMTEEVLNEPIGGRLLLDKNPMLTLLVPAFRRLFPEAVILTALRDPRDVVLSCYLRHLPLNTNSVWFLTIERTARRYAHDMGAWLKLRDKLNGDWLEVHYEEVVADLAGQARRCVAALGLPWNDSVLNYRDRLRGKPVTSPTYEAVTRPLYNSAIGRWHNYERHLRPVLDVLEPFVRAFGYA